MGFYNSSCVSNALAGITTDNGLASDLKDKTKDFEIDCLLGRTAKVTINNQVYYRNVANNTKDTIILTSPINMGESAIATVGAGDWDDDSQTGEGQITISCVGVGEVDYSVRFIAGVGENTSMSVTFNATTGVLTISSETNAIEEAVDILPGSVETLINNDVDLSVLFHVESNYIAGVAIPLTAEPVPFVGGVDPIDIVKGVPYIIF